MSKKPEPYKQYRLDRPVAICPACRLSQPTPYLGHGPCIGCGEELTVTGTVSAQELKL